MILNGHVLEYIDITHTYIVDGVIVPSVTEMLQVKFGGKYNGVDRATLANAAAKGTEIHKAIEEYCRTGTEIDLKEVRNFKFLKKRYGFNVLDNEIPVLLYQDGEPIAAGRLDMLIESNGVRGLADIKRTSALDKNYLAYQLNLYRIAYMQTYAERIDFLRGLHLREDTRKYVEIPINEAAAWEIVELYKEIKND